MTLSDPSPVVALIELRANLSAGASISPEHTVRLTQIVRDSFEPWSDAAEAANELTILLMQEKLDLWQRTYALDLIATIEGALRQKQP